MIIEDALNDFSTLQKDITDIERAMDKSMQSMDRFVKSFEKFLIDEEIRIRNITKSEFSYYEFYGLYDEYDKIWRQMAKYHRHLVDMGYKGFAKELMIAMSGLSTLMHRIQEYKHGKI